MTTLECLARLCALAPPLYYSLTRYHGMIAPCARLRKTIVPQPPRGVRPCCCSAGGKVASVPPQVRDACAARSVRARQDVLRLEIAPADARCRGGPLASLAAGPRRLRWKAARMGSESPCAVFASVPVQEPQRTRIHTTIENHVAPGHATRYKRCAARCSSPEAWSRIGVSGGCALSSPPHGFHLELPIHSDACGIRWVTG